MKAVSGWKAFRSVGLNVGCSPTGLLNSSGLSHYYAEVTPAVTYEGDNNVLMQQTARYILKAFDHIRKGKPLPESFTYYEKCMQRES